MSSFLRIWKQLDIKDIQLHLLVFGELSGECYNCHNIGLSSDTQTCPECMARFKYIGFRRKSVDAATLKRFTEKHPQVTFIDFDDFKKLTSKDQARKLLDL
jgi:hypothetical protein